MPFPRSLAIFHVKYLRRTRSSGRGRPSEIHLKLNEGGVHIIYLYYERKMCNALWVFPEPTSVQEIHDQYQRSALSPKTSVRGREGGKGETGSLNLTSKSGLSSITAVSAVDSRHHSRISDFSPDTHGKSRRANFFPSSCAVFFAAPASVSLQVRITTCEWTP